MNRPGRSGHVARRRGRCGERVAARWLRRRGYRVLGRNLRVGRYEIDLLVESPDGGQVIIIEVKAGRSSIREIAHRVDQGQMGRLQRAADMIHRGAYASGRSVRIDVMFVRLGIPCWHQVRHLRDESS